jgi:DNA polymerase-1
VRNTSKYFKRLKKDGLTKKDAYYMHGLRAAINTPIQGGAADIVIASMVKLGKNARLKELGWKLLLQIHDELILVLLST